MLQHRSTAVMESEALDRGREGVEHLGLDGISSKAEYRSYRPPDTLAAHTSLPDRTAFDKDDTRLRRLPG